MQPITTVVFHRADWDGLFCEAIARKFMPDAAFIGWDFGDAPLEIPKEGRIYVMDLPINKPFGDVVLAVDEGDLCFLSLEPPVRRVPLNRWVWLDHHKSSIENHPEVIPGYRIDGVAACRLAWAWFEAIKAKDIADTDPHNLSAFNELFLPEKNDFVGRNVYEPLAVTLAGEFDIWCKSDPRADIFQYGLDSEIEHNPFMFDWLLGDNSETYVQQIVAQGNCAMNCINHRNAEMIKSRSFIVEWEGLKFLALTTARCNSLTFMSRDVPETGHDALMGFFYNGSRWTISLYHARHRTDLDLSQIAVKYGGGGHSGACGFQATELPFNPNSQ